MLTSEVLDKAADLIEERGWTAGQGWPGMGPYKGTSLCLEGGIMAALGLEGGVGYGEFWGCPAYRAMQDYLALRDIAPFNWNDQPRRTASEVIEVLRAAALIEAAKENAETEPEPVEEVADAPSEVPC